MAADAAVGRAILRALLRQASRWAADAGARSSSSGGGGAGKTAATASASAAPARLAARAPLSTDAWRVGSHGLALAGDAYHAAAAAAILEDCGGLPPPPGGAWADGAALRAWILDAARSGSSSNSSTAASSPLDAGLAGLRALQAQRALERCSSSCTTAGIRVDATSAVVGRLPGAGRGGGGGGEGLALDFGSGRGGGRGGGGGAPSEEGERDRFLFTYRLRITHVGESDAGAATSRTASSAAPVRLVSRAWTIRDGRGRVHASVPAGSPGLVGATPTLRPGDCFEYYSATDLPGLAGVMRGAIGCVRLEEGGAGGPGGGGGDQSSASSSFDAAVAPFALHADPLGVGRRGREGARG
jgi:uncharacterized protein affecting Mg2+/Co2+ transport